MTIVVLAVILACTSILALFITIVVPGMSFTLALVISATIIAVVLFVIS